MHHPDNPEFVPSVIRRMCLARRDKPVCHILEKNIWQPYSGTEFLAAVSRYASLFSQYSEKSQIILFIKRMDFDLLTAFIGAMAAGHIPAQISPISQKTSSDEYQRKVDHILHVTGATCLFTDSDNTSFTPSAECSLLTPQSPAADRTIAPLQSQTALAQFSSGSTGLQKAVFLSHTALISHMDHYAQCLALSEQDRLITWLPLYHDMGLIACYLMPLMRGIPLYIMDPFDWVVNPGLLLQAIETHRATLCFLPNFAYHVLAEKCPPHDLSSMRFFVNCSEPARPETHRIFKAAFPTVRPEALTVCYALAENTFAVSQSAGSSVGKTRSIGGKPFLSCGKPVEGTEVRIFDPDETGVGEVGVRGSSLFSGFLDGSKPLHEGYYLTGDLGMLDSGDLYITGRKKDLMIVNGKNIYPQDVESASSQVEGVYPGRTVAFGIENGNTGSEEMFVLAERIPGAEPIKIKIAIQQAVEKEVGLVPRRVEVVEHMSLVKTSSGKISRSRNRELYLQKKLNLC